MKTDLEKLTNKQLAAIIGRLGMLKAFIKSVEVEAMMLLSRDPSAVPGFKLVEGRSRRQWRDKQKIIAILTKAGFKIDEFAPRELGGLGDISKLLPKAKREPFINANTTKPHGRPTLAPETDSRPRIGGNALLDFADELELEE